MLKVVDVIWITGRETIGLIACESEYDGMKYYMAPVTGDDLEQDIEYIKEWGTKVDPDIFERFFNRNK
jgi:hypothetical protein